METKHTPSAGLAEKPGERLAVRLYLADRLAELLELLRLWQHRADRWLRR